MAQSHNGTTVWRRDGVRAGGGERCGKRLKRVEESFRNKRLHHQTFKPLNAEPGIRNFLRLKWNLTLHNCIFHR
jgi:hypothetical protein